MRIRLIAMVSLCYLLSSSLFCVGRSFQCSSFSTNSIGRTAAMMRSKSSHITLDRRKLTSLEASKHKSSHFSTLMEVQPVTPAQAVETTTTDEIAPFHVDCLAKTSDELSFVVYGEPMSLQRHRVLRSGITYNPSSKLQKQFLDSCASILPDSPLEGPLEARMVFYFKRPLSHYGTGKNKAILKPGMDIWHSKRKGTSSEYISISPTAPYLLLFLLHLNIIYITLFSFLLSLFRYRQYCKVRIGRDQQEGL